MMKRVLFLLLGLLAASGLHAFDAHVLDPSFGAFGQRVISFDLGGERNDRAAAAFATLDGKTVVVGRVSIAGGSRVGLTRLLADGSLDTSFGSGGKVVLDLCMDRVAGVQFLSSSFLIFGETSECSTDASVDLRIAKVLANGSLDSSFGSSGVVSRSFDPNAVDRINGIFVYSDGRLLLYGGVIPQGQSVERPTFEIIPGNGVGTLSSFTETDFAENASYRSALFSGSKLYFLVERAGTTLATSGAFQTLTGLSMSAPIGFASTSSGNANGCSLGLRYRPVALAQVGSYIYAVGHSQSPFLQLFFASILATDNSQGRTSSCLSDVVVTLEDAVVESTFLTQLYYAGTCTVALPNATTSSQMCLGRLRQIDSGPQLVPDTTFNPNGGLPVSTSFTAAAGQTPISFGETLVQRTGGRVQLIGSRRWNQADEDYAVAQFGTPALLRNGFESN